MVIVPGNEIEVESWTMLAFHVMLLCLMYNESISSPTHTMYK